MTGDLWPLTVTAGAVIFLLWLVLHLRMSAFLALLLTSIVAAIAAGMPPLKALDTIQNGMGGTLGFIAVIVGLGSILGGLLQASGAVGALAEAFVARAPGRLIGWFLGLLGLLVAIPVFFDVALIILAPVVFGLAARLRVASVLLAVPLLAGLATAHAFVPPTPGPMAVADLLGADIGWVALFGFIAGLPAMLMAGPFWARLLTQLKWVAPPAADAGAVSAADAPQTTDSKAVNRAAMRALAVIALPLVLILMGTMAPLVLGVSPVAGFFRFLGHPFVALLITCGAAYGLFRPAAPEARAAFRATCERALEPAGAVILVTGAGGAFKQVLIDTGAGSQLAESVLAFGLTPLVAGFLLALLVRIAQGSATVAMITAAGLTAPVVKAAALSPHLTALTVVAIAAGATAVSHVNDSGFWLVSRYFKLDTATTLRTWTVCSSLIGFVGFAATLALSLFI